MKKKYMTKKMKQKRIIKKYIALITLGLIVPTIAIGYTSQKLNKDITVQEPVIFKIEIIKEKEPVNIIYEVKNETIREVTMFTSRVEETDSTPCISANNTNICEGIKKGINYCASNFYKFGTMLNVAGLGDCVVVDRMNSRYTNRIDWYAGEGQDSLNRALKFGRQKLLVRELK